MFNRTTTTKKNQLDMQCEKMGYICLAENFLLVFLDLKSFLTCVIQVSQSTNYEAFSLRKSLPFLAVIYPDTARKTFRCKIPY